MTRSMIFLAGAAFAASFAIMAPAQAQTVMQQCGQQYQAAKAANTLNGMTWNAFRSECAARLKAQPAAVTAPAAPAPAIAVKPVVVAPAAPAPVAPAATTAAAPAIKAPSAGRAAETARQRQCGAEWRAQKASLVAATPGLTWPKYWSQCNTRLKAAGQ